MDALYRLCQEAITNSTRHGKAKNTNIILKFSEDKIRLFIFDDGCGCQNIKKGFGLSGMEQRIHNIHGSIVYGSDGESGFNIRVELPLKPL
jgi:signal transduction histidine kinase